MDPEKRKTLAGVIAVVILLGLIAGLVVISPSVAHEMERYRANPPADTSFKHFDKNL